MTTTLGRCHSDLWIRATSALSTWWECPFDVREGGGEKGWGPASRRKQGPNRLAGCVPYGSGTSAVTLPISANSVLEVYSFTEIVP